MEFLKLLRATRVKWRRSLPFLFASLLLIVIPFERAWGESSTPSKEYQVKAVFLLNFAQFVDWPGKDFASDASPFVIGVLGHDPFGDYLDEVVRDEKVKGHPVEVRRFHRLDDVQLCHVLFIVGGEVDEVELRRLATRSILTVGESDRFTANGGIVRFATEKGKLHLRINLEAAKTSALVISSKLLRSADIVKSGGK